MPDTGLFYNYYRDYDPQTGKYLQPDPIGLYGGSFSTYAYANGNPISGVDPLGLSVLIIGRNYISQAALQDAYNTLTQTQLGEA
jgi:uncharacterized protein RhaS with RHS repeats